MYSFFQWEKPHDQLATGHGCWNVRRLGSLMKSAMCSRVDAEAEAPILWPPDVKSRLFGKDPDAGKD